jgi:hypothetical protein
MLPDCHRPEPHRFQLIKLPASETMHNYLPCSAPQTPAAISIPRAPLSPSTLVSPSVTPNSTFGTKASCEDRSKVQAAAILSKISSRSPVLQSRTIPNPSLSNFQEPPDYFTGLSPSHQTQSLPRYHQECSEENKRPATHQGKNVK